MEQSELLRCIAQAKSRLKRAEVELAFTRELAEKNDLEGAFGTAFAFAAEVEKLALLARALPAYTGHPKALELMDKQVAEIVPVEMGYTEQGWFCLRIPAILPKKEGGSPIYIQQYLYPAMRRFFSGKMPACYSNCVLIYRHIYEASRPERAYRDHDNIELNMVTDILALYLMPDDSAMRCFHYYCSAVGPADCTEAYIVPREQFVTWLYAAIHNRLKEAVLYEDLPERA